MTATSGEGGEKGKRKGKKQFLRKNNRIRLFLSILDSDPSPGRKKKGRVKKKKEG